MASGPGQPKIEVPREQKFTCIDMLQIRHIHWFAEWVLMGNRWKYCRKAVQINPLKEDERSITYDNHSLKFW